MYISKKNKQIIKEKFGNKCAYSGTDLDSDWQIDHVKAVVRNIVDGKFLFEGNHNIDNMFPTQKIINHYKHSYSVEDLRYLLKGLHLRIAKLPKNPKTKKSKKHKIYMLKLASYFNITETNQFSGVFYFETIKEATYKNELHTEKETCCGSCSNVMTNGFCEICGDITTENDY